MKNYLFTSESVSEGHPDKVADQISDAILDEFLRQDEEATVACETFCGRGLVIVGGEVCAEHAYVDIQETARRVIDRIGYNRAELMFSSQGCGLLSFINAQSPDIRRGVLRDTPEEQGAGDQGMMFGYACRDTEDYMPLALALSHKLLTVLSDIRHNRPGVMDYLRPDAKSQFTIEYDGQTGRPLRIHTIVLSTQHDEFDSIEAMHARIEQDVREIVLPELVASLPEPTAALFKGDYKLLVNPTGNFVIGGPAGDTGLTGRKIIVDTYGGKGAHGGGAFSGKDPSKVDRSAAYAARYIAKNMVAAGVADEMLVQLAYAIGVAEPVSIFVNTYGTARAGLDDGAIAEGIARLFDLRPASIIRKFHLLNPIYEDTASYGHFGKKPFTRKVTLIRDLGDGLGRREVEREIQFYDWEKLDSVDVIREFFNI